MRLYQDRVLIDTLPAWKKRKGALLNRLVGINFSVSERITVEPVYLPLVVVERWGGVATIEINGKGPLLIIFLFGSWPFVHIQKVTEGILQ